MNFDMRIFWDLLNDIDGQYFLMAVYEFIKTTKEIYPGTNIIAIIRDNAITLQEKVRQENTLKIETETEKERIDRWQKEAVPMPEDCKQALSKLGIKIGVNNT